MALENELIAWLKENLPKSSRMQINLGDDAAVFRCLSGSHAVVTTDMLTDGVDFLLDEVDPQQVGHKSLGVNLSDLAAMAARPVAVFVSLVLPRQGTASLSPLQLAIEMYRGMLPLAEKFEVVIAGGDTNAWEGPLAVSITAIGETTAQGPLTRPGGQVGDQLLVTGQLGGSILGRHLAVEPRVNEALKLHQRYELTAGIDISDGLTLDVSRLAAASGMGAVLDLAAIPITEDAHRLSEQDGRSPLEHALSDGEDFELVLTASAEVAAEIIADQPLDIPVTRIGELVETPGLWQADATGKRLPLVPQGFEHQGNE